MIDMHSLDRARYLDALEHCTAEVARAAESLGLPSGFPGWSIAGLIRHTITAQGEAVLVALGGEDARPAPADDISLVHAWEGVALELQRIVETSQHGGPSDAATAQLLLHAWDIRTGLARVGLAQRLEYPDAVVAWLDEHGEGRGPAATTPQAVPAGASATDALMARFGRGIPSYVYGPRA